MTDATASREAFQQTIYRDLDSKLRESQWNSGASEAHGLLTGLACRGVEATAIQNKMFLFQVSDESISLMLEGLFSLVLRDLSSEDFTFGILLPADDVPTLEKTEEVCNWCAGFLQGFCHDGDSIIKTSQSISEIVDDFITIGHMEIDPAADDVDNSESEKNLFEVQEYLKVSAQLVFDEINGDKISSTTTH